MGKKFKGIGCPCITPFNKNDSLSLVQLREVVDFLVNNEINAIVTTATCSEAYTLSDDEYFSIIDAVIDQVNEAVPVYVGLPTASTNRVLSIAKYAHNAGVDGVITLPPWIPSLPEKDLVNYFEYLASQIQTDIIIVNDPDNSKIDLSPSMIKRLSKQDNIIGMLELSSEFKKMKEIASEVKKDFYVYTGRGLLVPQAITEGEVEGAIVPSANIVPNLLVELYDAYNVEMMERFEEIQQKLIPLEIGLKLGPFPVTIKTCLELMGIKVGLPRKPLGNLKENDIEKLRNILIAAEVMHISSEETTETE